MSVPSYTLPLWRLEGDRIASRQKDPGTDICLCCPSNNLAHCGTGDQVDDSKLSDLLRRKKPPEHCLYAWSVERLRLRGVKPAKAKRIADRVAAATLAAGNSEAAFRRGIDNEVSRLEFMDSLERSRHDI